MNLRKLTASILFLIGLRSFAVAQVPTYIHINVIKNLNSLSVANVSCIVRDKFNYTWIAAQEGLFRYDGINSFYYGKNTGNSLHDLPNNSVHAIIFSADSNYLWAFNSPSGISKIDLRTGNIIKYIVFHNADISSENYFIRGTAVINSKLYFSFENGVIGRLDPETDSVSYSNLHNSIISFGRINDYLYCINAQYKIIFLDSNFNKVYNELLLVQMKGDSRLQTYVKVDDHTIIIALNKNLLQLNFNKDSKTFSFNSYKNLKPFSSNITTIQLVGRYLYVGLEDKLLCYNTGNNDFTQLSVERNDDQKWLKGALAIKQFGEELWIGNELGIATNNTGNKFFTAFTQPLNSDFKFNHCYGLCKTNSGELLVNTTEGLFAINLLTHAGKKLDSKYYLYSVKGPDDIYISSHTSGSTFWKDTPAAGISPGENKMALALKDDIFIGNAVFKDSLLFLASLLKKGLAIYNLKNSALNFIGNQTKPYSLKNSNINQLFINSRQELLIVCENVVSTFNIQTGALDNKQILDPASGQPLNVLHDICEISDRYYLAVYGVGIVETDLNFKVLNIFNKKNGIENINLYKIFNIGDSVLLTSSNNGLFVFNLRRFQASRYYEHDGLHGNGFEQFSGCRLNDSLIVLGGINGFTVININHLGLNNHKPLLYFNKISIETSDGRFDSSNLLIDKIEIPSNALQTTISLSGINYSNSARVTFSWRIKEKSSDWIDIGTQSFISFIGLSPGKYHLLVRAANEDGIYCDPKELVLEFLPKWYQTWWFKLLNVVVIFLLLYALYNFRLNQIKKQHEIRKNIATDLHDDLGSTLTSISVFTNLAIGGINQKENLQIIKQNLSGATLGLRDMIWVLDDSLDTVDDFITRLQQYILPIVNANKIETIFSTDALTRQMILGKNTKRNLFLICKEAVNNCIKYSGASKLKLSFERTDRRLKITIQDNGNGFDMDKIKTGYGLKNMHYRADKIKYHIKIDSGAGKGTIIEIIP